MSLNPDRNLYSVAPVGNVIVIGRNMALRGGLTRENAINLIAWLAIATNAKPEEISAEIRSASTSIPKAEPKAAVARPPAAALHVANPAEVASRKAEPFIESVDNEEVAAIAEAVKKAGESLNGAETPVIDGDQLTKAWS